MAGRAAHVDIDNFGACGFGDPRAFGHPFSLATRELNHMRTYSGRLASQPRHRTTIDQVLAGGHLGNDEPGAERCGQTSKRRISNPRHRREKDPVDDFNAAYFQWVGAGTLRAGHGLLVFLADASSRLPGVILSTNLVQSSFMPTL